MPTFLSQIRAKGDLKPAAPGRAPKAKVVFQNYTSLPVSIPPDFLSPLPEPDKTLKIQRVDFKNSLLKEYAGSYAVVIDGVFTQAECEELVGYAEQSAGLGRDSEGDGEENGERTRGWHAALVNAGRNKGIFAPEYRNSDRIIWNSEDIAKRIWERVRQAREVRDYLEVLEGEKYGSVLGHAGERGEKYIVAERGLNESLKFLKYGPGQFFKEHRDGTYETGDGSQRSFYTLHLYLNDSVAGLNPEASSSLIDLDQANPEATQPTPSGEPEMLEGGATTFYSSDKKYSLDVHPKVGRVLIFQQKGLMHSGAEVVRGTKYTMRSDVMYEFRESEDDGGIVFG